MKFPHLAAAGALCIASVLALSITPITPQPRQLATLAGRPMAMPAPSPVLPAPLELLAASPLRADRALVAARAHLADREGAGSLVHRDTFVSSDGGFAVVRFGQEIEGARVLGRGLAVVVGAEDAVAAVTGRIAPVSAPPRWPERPDAERVLVEREGVLVPAYATIRGASFEVTAAEGSAVLRTQSLAHAATYRVFGPNPYEPPTISPRPPVPGAPRGTVPARVEAQDLTLASVPYSQNDPWLPRGATSLSGNAVLALVGDAPVTTTAPDTFARAAATDASPTTDAQRGAAATQAFYTASFLHDWFYDAGFDELAGNAQATNFGRGGRQGDRLVVAADVAALEGRSEAVIPPDGTTPRLAFGLYRGANGRPDRQGALDTSLVAHEWGHLLAERLVGDAIGLGNPQGQAISEGVADMVALLVTLRAEDVTLPGNANWNAGRPVGSWAASARDDDGYYFGLRRQPYSTDFLRDALTFRHVTRGAPLPTTAPMRASDPAENALPQNAGELWATALHGFYASLLNAHPFMEAQDRMKRYLVGGLRATPAEPTMVEAANALRAVVAANDPADAQRMDAAFARRGLGAGAVAPPRTSADLVGVVESYATNGALRVLGVTVDDGVRTCDADGVLDPDEEGTLRITLENGGRVATDATSFTVTSPALAFAQGSALFLPRVEAGARTTVSTRVTLSGTPASAAVQLQFPSGLLAAGVTYSSAVGVNHDESISATTDAMETRGTTLAFERNGVRQPFVATRDAADSFAHVDDGPAGTRALLTGPLAVNGALGVAFRVRHSLVGTGSVQVSEDGLAFREVAALTGQSQGFPAFAPRTLDLGAGYAGKTVFLRFVVAAGGAGTTAYGLDIDDLAITGIDGTPFARRVPEVAGTCNRAPIASAGPDVTVTQAAGTPGVVPLAASSSFDPDGDTLTFAWTQLAGPKATIDGASAANATAQIPALDGDALLVFQVAVSDGTATSLATVRITARRSGSTTEDAGAPPTTPAEPIVDAGVTPVGEDAASPSLPASPDVPNATPAPEDDGGCTMSPRASSQAWPLLAGILLAVRRRRRST